MELPKLHRANPLIAIANSANPRKLSIITESTEDLGSDSGSGTLSTEEVPGEEAKLESIEMPLHKSVSYADRLLGYDSAYIENEQGSKTSLDQSLDKSPKSALEQNFFETFTELPDLDDMSEDEGKWINEEYDKFSIKRSINEIGIDPGRFVDSVTGIEIKDDTEEEIEKEPSRIDEQATDAITEEEESEEIVPSEDDDLLHLLQEFDYEDDEEDVGDAEVIEEDMLNEFLQMESKENPRSVFVADVELLAEIEEARQVRLCIMDFVDDLIIGVIKNIEHLDVRRKLRKKLDKHALINSILGIFSLIKVENKARSFLNRRIIDHFRRKKLFDSITERSYKDFEKDFAQYKEAITHLDEMLGKEAATTKAVKGKIEQLKNELAQMEASSANAEESLKTLIKGTLAREGFDRLKTHVEKQVNNMMALHTEMSGVRFKLMQRQHTFAMLDEKLKKLERITENLQLRDYENLQAETQTLSKKIEERNIELTKARKRMNCNLHMLSHMHAKEAMLKNFQSTHTDMLSALHTQKQATREYMSRLNLRRFRILQEIKRTNFKGGLLSKPHLMHDFDETVARNQALRARIHKLNQRQAYLNEKIAQITEKIESKSR